MANAKFRRNYKATSKFAFIIILGAVLSLLGSTVAKSESAPIFYTLRVSCIRNDVALHVKEGDSIIEAVGKFPLGRVEKVTLSPSEAETYNEEKNEMTLAKIDGYSDIYIEVSALGEEKDNEGKIGAYTLYEGKTVYFRLPDFSGEGVCILIGEGQK